MLNNNSYVVAHYAVTMVYIYIIWINIYRANNMTAYKCYYNNVIIKFYSLITSTRFYLALNFMYQTGTYYVYHKLCKLQTR